MKKVLNYPGSKWNISEKIAFMIPKHKCYVEPFFGSGAVFFSKPYISPIETINDINSDVVNLFTCIKIDAQRLANMVQITPYSRESYNAAYMSDPVDPFVKALHFLIKCWQGMGYRANGDKVDWKKIVFNAYNQNGSIREECIWMNCSDDQMSIFDFGV